jgi:hypothetical protein
LESKAKPCYRASKSSTACACNLSKGWRVACLMAKPDLLKATWGTAATLHSYKADAWLSGSPHRRPRSLFCLSKKQGEVCLKPVRSRNLAAWRAFVGCFAMASSLAHKKQSRKELVNELLSRRKLLILSRVSIGCLQLCALR